ncbi:MAG: hypothetical protein JWO30_3260 [Fibrobacteres bacterium]|nr:hypothetical protein [Fibrobacterota bacterium]
MRGTRFLTAAATRCAILLTTGYALFLATGRALLLTTGCAFFLTTGCALLLTTGCALMHPRPTAWDLPPLETGTMPGRRVQSLRLERQGKSLELMAVIENDGKTFTLAGLSPMGQRLVLITWSGGKVAQESDPNLPVAIDGEAILRDIVLVNWPESSLTRVFAKTGWSADFKGPERKLSWRGRPWVSVRPEAGEGGETGEGVLVDHLAEGYQVHVTTVERDSQ